MKLFSEFTACLIHAAVNVVSGVSMNFFDLLNELRAFHDELSIALPAIIYAVEDWLYITISVKGIGGQITR